MKPKKRIPVKSQIEAIKGITKREILLSKNLGQNPAKVPLNWSNEEIANFFMRNFPESHFVIHQHIKPKKRKKSWFDEYVVEEGGFPSGTDILTYSDLLAARKAKASVIVSVNKKGQAMGYFFFKMKKKLSPKDYKLVELVRNGFPYKGYLFLVEKYLKKYSFRHKAFAFRGFKFDKEKGMFIPVSADKLIKKT